jgi:hypothetical protein
MRHFGFFEYATPTKKTAFYFRLVFFTGKTPRDSVMQSFQWNNFSAVMQKNEVGIQKFRDSEKY